MRIPRPRNLFRHSARTSPPPPPDSTPEKGVELFNLPGGTSHVALNLANAPVAIHPHRKGGFIWTCMGCDSEGGPELKVSWARESANNHAGECRVTKPHLFPGVHVVSPSSTKGETL